MAGSGGRPQGRRASPGWQLRPETGPSQAQLGVSRGSGLGWGPPRWSLGQQKQVEHAACHGPRPLTLATRLAAGLLLTPAPTPLLLCLPQSTPAQPEGALRVTHLSHPSCAPQDLHSTCPAGGSLLSPFTFTHAPTAAIPCTASSRKPSCLPLTSRFCQVASLGPEPTRAKAPELRWMQLSHLQARATQVQKPGPKGLVSFL